MIFGQRPCEDQGAGQVASSLHRAVDRFADAYYAGEMYYYEMRGDECANDFFIEHRPMNATNPWVKQLRTVEGAIGAAEIVEDSDPPAAIGVQASQVTSQETGPARYQHRVAIAVPHRCSPAKDQCIDHTPLIGVLGGIAGKLSLLVHDMAVARE